MRYCQILLIFLVLFFVSVSTCFSTSSGPAFIVPEKYVKKLPCCSRRCPDVDSFWTPKQSHIEEIEKKLPDFYKNVVKKDPYYSLQCFEQFPRKMEPLSYFYRQYLGIVTEGRREIYVNFFSKMRGEESVQYLKKLFNDLPHSSRQIEYLKKEGFVFGPELTEHIKGVCDGGPNYWGFRYKLNSQKFGAPYFNGGIGINCEPEQWKELKNTGFIDRLEEKRKEEIKQKKELEKKGK